MFGCYHQLTADCLPVVVMRMRYSIAIILLQCLNYCRVEKSNHKFLSLKREENLTLEK